MKISKEELKKIIKEEIEQSVDFGKDAVSQAQQVKKYKQSAVDSAKQQGTDNKERGIISQIEKNLQTLAAISDIKSGNVFAILNKLNKMMEAEIQKIEGVPQEKEQSPEPQP